MNRADWIKSQLSRVAREGQDAARERDLVKCLRLARQTNDLIEELIELEGDSFCPDGSTTWMDLHKQGEYLIEKYSSMESLYDS